MRVPTVCCALAGAVLLGVIPVNAQSTQGVILGQVIDWSTSLSIKSARIECVNTETQQKLLTSSDRFGLYAFASLSPGTYTVTATENKYQAQEARAVQVAVASRVELNFRLRPLSDLWEAGRFGAWRIPGTQRTLRFYGPDVDTSRLAVFTANTANSSPLDTSRSDVIGKTAVDDLPLTGRDVYTMLLLLPGVTSDTGTARGLGFSAFGQRPSSSEYLLDGADNNLLLTTGPLNAAPPEFIQEYRVSIGSFTAEFGRTSGFVANAITRAGTNVWHAAGFFHLENERLDANGYQENANNVARRPMTQSEGGFTGGGPLVRRKLFVSGGLDRLRTKSLADPQLYALPTAEFIQSTSPSSYIGALFREFPLSAAPNDPTSNAVLVPISPPADFSRSDEYARLDYQPTSADRVSTRFLRDALDQPEFLFSPYAGFSTSYVQASISGSAAWTRRFGTAFLNELRGSRSGDAIRFEAPNAYVPQLALPIGTRIMQNGQSYDVTLPGPPSQYNYRNRGSSWEGADTLTGVWGRQLWKTGGSFFHRSIALDLGFTPGGNLLFSGFSDLAGGVPEELNVEVDRYGSAYAPVQPSRQYRYRQAYGFAQDSMRLTDRLTLDFGLRYEKYGAPVNIGSMKDTLIVLGSGTDIESTLAGALAVTPTSGGNEKLFSSAGLNLAPRAGLAWDVTGAGRTILRASYGIFYDRPFDNLWENAVQNRYETAAFQNFVSPLPAGATTAEIEAAGVYTTSSQLVNGLVFQPRLRAPRVQNAFAGVQENLRDGISVEVNGLASRGRGLITTDIMNRPFSLPQTTDDPLGSFNSSFSLLDYRANQGKSQYAALSGTVRMHRGALLAQASYTMSHSEDNQSDPLANSFFNFNQFEAQQSPVPFNSAFTRQFDSGADWANSDFDQRRNFVGYTAWTVPAREGRRWLSQAWRHWSLAGLVAARSGLPFSVYATQTVGNFSNKIVNERADLLNPAQASISIPGPGGTYLLNPAAFGPPAGIVGNTGRNAFTGPGLFSADASLSRAFPLARLRESARLVIRADAYNVLNHANLNNPDSTLGSSTFGLATAGRSETASGFPLIAPLRETARIVQILLRAEF